MVFGSLLRLITGDDERGSYRRDSDYSELARKLNPREIPQLPLLSPWSQNLKEVSGRYLSLPVEDLESYMVQHITPDLGSEQATTIADVFIKYCGLQEHVADKPDRYQSKTLRNMDIAILNLLHDAKDRGVLEATLEALRSYNPIAHPPSRVYDTIGFIQSCYEITAQTAVASAMPLEAEIATTSNVA